MSKALGPSPGRWARGYNEVLRQITALLLAAALIPGPVSASVRVGLVAEAGLSGMPLTPAPGQRASVLTASPLTMSAAGLTPSLARVAPIAPALVAPIAPSAMSAPAATRVLIAAITPAAATPEKGDDSGAQAMNAANALFDGTLAAPAKDDPVVPGAFGGVGRTSGLSPPTDTEIADAYRAAKPASSAADFFGSDLTHVAASAVAMYTFVGDYVLESLKPSSIMDFLGRAQYEAFKEILDVHDARGDSAARRFSNLLGRWKAAADHASHLQAAVNKVWMRQMGYGEERRHLTPNPLLGGEYWDMASGMNAQQFMYGELEPNTNYSFFDYSPFVAAYLNAAAGWAGAANAKVVEGDINALVRPAKPIAVLRTKNAVHYVPGFDKKLEEMVDWIAPGGQLVIQNDPIPGQRALIMGKHGPLIGRLLAEGWTMQSGFSGYPGPYSDYALDTLTLTRPAGAAMPRDAAGVARLWNAYVAVVAHIDADFHLRADLSQIRWPGVMRQ